MNRLINCQVLILLALIATAAGAQERQVLEQAKDVKRAAIQDGVKTQKSIDNLDDERLQMLSDYRATLKQVEDMDKYNDHLQVLIKSQDDERKSLNSQIDRVAGLEREIVPLMSDMLDSLEEFINLDIPFLIDERHKRIAKLRSLLNDSNISNSEKYRRILEAYQIENDYGRYVEAYEGTIGSGGQAQIVNFLKIGRISFIYQSKDGKSSYMWNRKDKNWERLDDSYNPVVRTAINMARDYIPKDLMFVPVRIPDSVM